MNDFENYNGGGSWGADYGDSSGADYGAGVGAPGDWGMNYGADQTFDPEAYLASQGGYTPPVEPGVWDQIQGMPAQMGSAFMKHLQKDPVGVLSQLGGLGAGLYSTIQGNKQREAAARQMQDAKNKREATLARYGAVLPMKMERSMLPQGDLLHAGERSGGTNWFTPAQFRPMAEGGAVKPSWIDSLFARKPAPAVVGSGTAAAAGNALQDRNYRLYLQMQEMEGAKPLPYDVWAAQQGKGMAGGGALSRLLKGPGDGTSDNIPINAADGEYVFSAQDVSDIGNGSNEAGAKKLDEMRQRLRAHKKRSPKLAPDAKNPEAYIKGSK